VARICVSCLSHPAIAEYLQMRGLHSSTRVERSSSEDTTGAGADVLAPEPGDRIANPGCSPIVSATNETLREPAAANPLVARSSPARPQSQIHRCQPRHRKACAGLQLPSYGIRHVTFYALVRQLWTDPLGLLIGVSDRVHTCLVWWLGLLSR
jgi:hypothetical protein